jgi:hypothetical protein
MKTGKQKTGTYADEAGASLVELLMYAGLLFLFVGIAYGTVDRLWLETRRLEKRADSLRGLVQAGEQWRADIRQSSADPTVDADGLGISIPTGTNQVRWTVEKPLGLACRDAGGGDIRIYPWPLQAAAFAAAKRGSTAGWTWDLTLAPPTKRDRQPQTVRFLAVAAGKEKP